MYNCRYCYKQLPTDFIQEEHEMACDNNLDRHNFVVFKAEYWSYMLEDYNEIIRHSLKELKKDLEHLGDTIDEIEMYGAKNIDPQDNDWEPLPYNIIN